MEEYLTITHLKKQFNDVQVLKDIGAGFIYRREWINLSNT